MPLDWMDVTDVSFNALLLMEHAQLTWFSTWDFPRPAISTALAANPTVAWYLRHKCPQIAPWVDAQLAEAASQGCTPARLSPGEIRQAEVAVLRSLVDLLVYALDPAIYDGLRFTRWDSRELTDLVDFRGQTVIDVGAGPGRLALTAAPLARVVYAVEPVGNLRRYLREKALAQGRSNLYAVDGLITAIPFEDGFADVVMSGHVFGDAPQPELAEVLRVTRPGGMVIFCPGGNDRDDPQHQYLVENGFQWAAFEEPGSGKVRKYWKVKEG